MGLGELMSKLRSSYTSTLACARLGIVMKERGDAFDAGTEHCIFERGAIKVDWHYWGHVYRLFTERSGIDICQDTNLAEWEETI
jgi:hypothetical protein